MNLTLAKITLNRSRIALGWISNPYRVHQRLLMVYEGEPRLLFRIEEDVVQPIILVQAHIVPNFQRAFSDFAVLARPPEVKEFELRLVDGMAYRFRILANPTVRRNGERLGLLKEEDQQAWLERKLSGVGAKLQGCLVQNQGLQKSARSPARDATQQTHLAARFEGVLVVKESAALAAAVESGIGPAKGFGFGLLSLGPV